VSAFELKETHKTPLVKIDPGEGAIKIKGKSIPEDGSIFYRPIMDEIDKMSANPPEKTKVDVQLEYFNTNSSKYLYQLFKKLEAIHTDKSQIEINWFYEMDDWDLMEAGEDYQSILKLPFNLIEIV
jgi:hypothetical protein